MEAQDQGGAAAAAGSSSCTSSWTKQKNHDSYSNNSKPFPHSLLHHTDNETKLGPSLPLSSNEDSDEDMFTVPDVEAPAAESGSGTITSRIGGGGGMMNQEQLQQQSQSSKRRSRGRNPVDKEYRRLKRLLRNRVSAQQARERKKVYVNDLEAKAKDLQDTNSKLEQKISTLINENNMLRKVLLNTRPKVDDSVEPKHD